jgi:hypothetical protein
VLDCVDLDDDYLIWPQPRAAVMEGIDDEMRPVLKRIALHWQNDSEGLPTVSVSGLVFGLIPVTPGG